MLYTDNWNSKNFLLNFNILLCYSGKTLATDFACFYVHCHVNCFGANCFAVVYGLHRRERERERNDFLLSAAWIYAHSPLISLLYSIHMINVRILDRTVQKSKNANRINYSNLLFRSLAIISISMHWIIQKERLKKAVSLPITGFSFDFWPTKSLGFVTSPQVYSARVPNYFTTKRSKVLFFVFYCSG